jgi:hypothetical protein
MSNDLESLSEEVIGDAIETARIDGLNPDQLEKLVHTLLARRIVEALRQPEPSPGIMQVARGFLRDNDVSALPIPDSAQAQLQEMYGEDAPFPLRISKEA